MTIKNDKDMVDLSVPQEEIIIPPCDENQRNAEFRKNIKTRLKRIEGQVKGIENMVEKSCCCKDVLVQIAAIRAAINKVGGLILENYAKECMLNSLENSDSREKIEDLVSTLSMFLK